MPRPNRLLVPLLLLVSLGCGAEEEEQPSATNPPVAIWRPDSARASGGAGDTARAAGDDAPAAVAGVPGSEPAAGGAGTGQPDAGGPTPAGARAGPGTPTSPPATDGRPAGTGGQGPAAGAEAILLRAERAYDAVRTLHADFVQELTVPLLESTQRSRGEIFHRKPDRFLMRFSDPAGDVVVADGRALWLYYPSNDAKQVIRTSMGEAGRLDLQREFLSNPTERFNATLVGSESVAGRRAKVIDLVPRAAAPYRAVRIWIDDQDALARRFRITETSDAVRMVELHDLRVNETLPDDLFTFTPPANAQVFDQ